MDKFIPSSYQQAIFDWVTNGRGDAVVQAVAGSGKTKTLVEAAKLLHSDRAVFLAFNRHIATELQSRLDGSMTAKTIHSVGMGTLRSHIGKVIVDDNKYGDIAKDYSNDIASDLFQKYQSDLRRWRKSRNDDDEPEEPPNAGFITGQLKKLAHFCRVTLTPVDQFDAVEEMVSHFGCLDDALELKIIHYPLMSILSEGERIAQNRGIVDYDDMLWLPNKWDLQLPPQEWVMCDEGQDLSPAQLDLVLKLRGKGGRFLFVADPKQAIYGFAGASSDSVEQIIKRTNATVLPLSICYRCPKSHIELAQKIVKQIEPAPNAIDGIVETVDREKLPTIIREGDLIISRCTAPAVKLCIELIAKRIPARVRGRDIGKGLTSIVREVAKHPNFEFSRFGEFLQEYRESRVAKLQQRKNSESQVESLRDRIEGIWVCYHAFNCQDINVFCREIEELFSDTRSSVVLSTVHRAKGLEEQRVFILEPEKLPLRWPNQLDWELQQEFNTTYVALTRAKAELYFVKEGVAPDEDETNEDEDNEEATAQE